MNTHQTGTNLNGIDAIKLFAACMVVLLHSTETFQVYLPSLVTHTFCELAVPFFFLASGYLFATGLETGKPSERMRKSTCKLVKLYAFWGIIALGPFLIYDYLNMDKYANASGAYMFLILMRRFFIAGAGPYWYLLGLLLSFFIIYPIRNKTRLLFILAASTLSLTIMYESFREHSSNILGLAQMCECLDFMYSGKNNFLTLGIPFTTIGYLIRKTNFHLPKHLAYASAFTATLLCLLEYMIQSQPARISTMYIVQSTAMFLAALEWAPNSTPSWSKKIRALSSFIYFSHWFVLYYLVKPILILTMNLQPWMPESIAPKAIITIIICTLIYLGLQRFNHPFIRFVTNG